MHYPVETLSVADIQALVNACYSAPSTGRISTSGSRNLTLITLLWRTGLRINEALSLRVTDINLQTNSISVLHAKGRKQRSVPIDPRTNTTLSQWLAIRRTMPQPDSYLLPTLSGLKLSSAYVRQLLPRLASQAGVTKRVHAHAFRHTYATELLAESIPLNHIQKLLGHSNLAVTSRYLDHVPTPDLQRAIQARDW